VNNTCLWIFLHLLQSESHSRQDRSWKSRLWITAAVTSILVLYWPTGIFFNWLKVSQLSIGHISLSESRTELPGAIIGRLWRRTAVAIYAITSFLNDQWIVGITWHKKKWMHLQLIHSKTTWRNVGDGRWTSLWTNNWSCNPMAARFKKPMVMIYLLKMHWLGAAAPGELPGELLGHYIHVL